MTSDLEHDQLRLLTLEIHPVAMENPAMNHEIVTFSVLEIAVHALENSAALADVHELIGLCVPIKKLVVLRRLDVMHRDVRVEQQRNPVERRTPAGFHARR